MADETFKPGDVVRLKSGGPKMTVNIVGSDRQSVYLIYYNEITNLFSSENFKLPAVALELVKDGGK